MSGEEGLTELGPWGNSDLGATARTNAGLGADAGLSASVRFRAGVAKLIRQRLQARDPDPARPAIFLLQPTPLAHRPHAFPKRVPMLDNGLTTVTGRLWFVNAVVAAGNYVELDDCDDDELFRIVTDDLKLGHVPAIVFDPRTGIPWVRFYPKGLGDLDIYEPLAVIGAKVSLHRIFDVIDRVHKHCLVTPEAQTRAGKLWANNARCWSSSQAEDTIQMCLKAGLTAAFPTCTVRHEQVQVSGRLDLEIEESEPFDRSRITRHAILELKVLRSYGSTGVSVPEQQTLDWVESGVKQAAAYRDDKGALASALCCFDMRRESTGERCFEHVREMAEELRVELSTTLPRS